LHLNEVLEFSWSWFQIYNSLFILKNLHYFPWRIFIFSGWLFCLVHLIILLHNLGFLWTIDSIISVSYSWTFCVLHQMIEFWHQKSWFRAIVFFIVVEFNGRCHFVFVRSFILHFEFFFFKLIRWLNWFG